MYVYFHRHLQERYTLHTLNNHMVISKLNNTVRKYDRRKDKNSVSQIYRIAYHRYRNRECVCVVQPEYAGTKYDRRKTKIAYHRYRNCVCLCTWRGISLVARVGAGVCECFVRVFSQRDAFQIKALFLSGSSSVRVQSDYLFLCFSL